MSKNLDDILTSIKRHNPSLHGMFVNNGLEQALRSLRDNPLNHIGLGGIADIAKKLERQTRSDLRTLSNLTSSWPKDILPDFQHKLGSYSLGAVMSKIDKQNHGLANLLGNIALRQIEISKKINGIAGLTYFDSESFRKFNVLREVAINSTNSFLDTIARERAWGTLPEIEYLETSLSAISSKLESQPLERTEDQFAKLKDDIIDELTPIITKANSPTTREVIMDLITIITFIYTFYSPIAQYISGDTPTPQNSSVVDTSDLAKFKHEIHEIFDEKLAKLNAVRVARCNVVLRARPRKQGRRIGLVTKNQEVHVLEVRHKWLLISFLDNSTGDPKSGYVFKKYFEKSRSK